LRHHIHLLFWNSRVLAKEAEEGVTAVENAFEIGQIISAKHEP